MVLTYAIVAIKVFVRNARRELNTSRRNPSTTSKTTTTTTLAPSTAISTDLLLRLVDHNMFYVLLRRDCDYRGEERYYLHKATKFMQNKHMGFSEVSTSKDIWDYWKCNFSLTRSVGRSFGRLVGLSLFPKRAGRYTSKLLSGHLIEFQPTLPRTPSTLTPRKS